MSEENPTTLMGIPIVWIDEPSPWEGSEIVLGDFGAYIVYRATKSQEGTMLFSDSVRTMMAEEQKKFDELYGIMIDNMKVIMRERGASRDGETPIHFRRSPEANLEQTRSKGSRIESMLAGLDKDDPDSGILKKVIVESLDRANYNLFNAVTLQLILDDRLNKGENK